MFDFLSSDMKAPSIASGILHAGIVIIALVGLPFFDQPPPPEPEPMIVDYEEIGPKAAAPVVAAVQPVSRAPVAKEVTAAPPPTSADKPPSEAAKPVEPPKPDKPVPPKPADQAQVKPPEPQKPQPDPEIALKPQQPEPPVKEPPKPAPTPTTELKKPEPPKPEPPKPVQQAKPTPTPAPQKQEKSVEDILANVLKNKDPTPQPHKPVQESPKPAQPTRTASTAPNYAARLTTSEMSAMADKVRPCWNINPDAMDARTMVVEIIVDMQQDGTVSGARIGDGIRINGAQHMAFAQAALRAVQNPRCQPLPYPHGKYESLRQFIFRFDPRDL